uniref:Serine/threonine-protein kinase par-4 n=1 Tax=Caenorhabditis japonica TaxID=281687 RepID=A0A8R1I5W5_CAEJA
MEGPSSAAAAANTKFIVPDADFSSQISDGRRNSGRVTLNVDPDFVDVDQGGSEDDSDDECFEDGQLIREPRRSRENDAGVKMSIGHYDDLEEDEEEDEEEQRRRFAEGIRNIHQNKQQESFDLEPEDSDAMRQLVNTAMMFNTDNQFQRIDFEPVGKRKTPKIIEGYLWGAQIGTGSYGKVKEVIDTFTLTRRAAKIMKYDKLRKITNGWENIRSEMAILRRLNHKNVIKLVEVFNIPTKGKVYMIFEYCIGSVQQLLDLEPARRLSIGESHAIFAELCHGLNYLHSKRISHKDIKPGNLLVAIDFTIKICDFGVAEQISIFQNDGTCTKVNGTPKFQPPECVHGNHSFFDGYKADMWSAGVTLYNLVSGKYPFEKPVLLKLYECIGTEPLVMPTNVLLSNELQDLLRQLLEKDFTRRLGCQETMLHPWFMSSFPEDQGLGRIMERMRTGDRPLTMIPSMMALYDGLENEVEIDEDGKEVVLLPRLTIGGELDHDTFRGFKYLEATPADQLLDGAADDDALNPMRRPSSRSMPTSAPVPQPIDAVTTPVAPSSASAEFADASPSPQPKKSRQRKKRSIFACIFRSRTDSV